MSHCSTKVRIEVGGFYSILNVGRLYVLIVIPGVILIVMPLSYRVKF